MTHETERNAVVGGILLAVVLYLLLRGRSGSPQLAGGAAPDLGSVAPVYMTYNLPAGSKWTPNYTLLGPVNVTNQFSSPGDSGKGSGSTVPSCGCSDGDSGGMFSGLTALVNDYAGKAKAIEQSVLANIWSSMPQGLFPLGGNQWAFYDGTSGIPTTGLNINDAQAVDLAMGRT